MLPSLISRLSDNDPTTYKDSDKCTVTTFVEFVSELKMLLESRVRLPEVGNMPYINSTILNYGFDESFHTIHEPDARRVVLEKRLKQMFERFEPRLINMSISSDISIQEVIQFTLTGDFQNMHLVLKLSWDDYSGVFYFNE